MKKRILGIVGLMFFLIFLFCFFYCIILNNSLGQNFITYLMFSSFSISIIIVLINMRNKLTKNEKNVINRNVTEKNNEGNDEKEG